MEDSDKTFAVPAPRPAIDHASQEGGSNEFCAPDPQYDVTGASYEALFLDGGLFSHFVNDEDDLGDGDAMWPAYDDGDDGDGLAYGHVADAGQPLRPLPIGEAVDALLATCPRMMSSKPATLALERAPLVHVIRRHMRTEGPVDFAPNGGGLLCASLAEACKSVEGLGPVVMLERGVVAWLAGRLMERVRPGSSRGVPVGPMSRIGAFVQAEFGDGWTFYDLEQLDARFDEPQHEPLRALLAWLVDSARTVAMVRDGVAASSDAAPHRPPNGKDYTFGPLRRLKPDRKAYLSCDPHDAAAWASFLEQAKPAKRDVQPAPPRERTGARRGRRPLARSLPAPKPHLLSARGTALATSVSGTSLSTSSSPSLECSTAHVDRAPLAPSPSSTSRAPQPLPLPAGPPLPPPPPPPPQLFLSPPPPLLLPTTATAATQVIAPTALDATTLDRAVLAQVQSIALMTLSATDPATLASGAHVAFMAPSITCPGAMAFTCWIELPPGADDICGGTVPPPTSSTAPLDANDARPRKRPRVARQPRRAKTTAHAKRSTNALCAVTDAGGTDSESRVVAHPAETTCTSASASCTTTTTVPEATTTALNVAKAGPCVLPPEAHAMTLLENNARDSGPQSAPDDPQADGGQNATRDAMIDASIDQTVRVHDMQLDAVHPLPPVTCAANTQNSKPTEATEFERLFVESTPDEWDELLAGGRLPCG
nr:hypothetical protein [Pandoravirus aubagnensis]